MTYESNLAEAAQPAEAAAPQKKQRTKTEAEPKSYPQFNADGTPLLGEDGKQVWGPDKFEGEIAGGGKKAKKAKAPKVVEYEKNEDGTDKLDEAGNPIPVKKTRAPKLDADGNPIPRISNVFLDSQVITITDAGLKANYRPDSKRGQIFASIKDGQTVGEFYANNGGKKVSHTFLVWYLNEAKVIDINSPAEPA